MEIGLQREYAGNHLVGRPRKRWVDTVKDCLRKRGLAVRKARRMVGVCEEECMGCRGMKICLWSSLQLKGHKGENSFFFSFFS